MEYVRKLDSARAYQTSELPVMNSCESRDDGPQQLQQRTEKKAG